MGFGKAFGFSLLAFIGLNFLFLIIAHTISGNLNLMFGDISAQPLILFALFLGPIYYFPGSAIMNTYSAFLFGVPLDVIILSIGTIVSPLIAAIIAGRVGENKAGSFLGWFLTSILCAVILGIFAFIDTAVLSYYGIPIGDPTMTLVTCLFSGVVNGIFYGAFALLLTKTEYY